MINNILISLFIAVGISALGILLAGLPGVLILWLSQPLIVCLFGMKPLDKITPGAGFALMYLVSMLWSLSILPGYLVAFKLFEHYEKWSQIAIFIGVIYLVSVILSTILYGWTYLFYRVPHR